MNFDIDSGKLLYALGVLFAAAAFLYFVRDVVFGLSITVKAALLFIAFVAFFVGGVAIDRDVLDVVSFALSGASYVVFMGYVVSRYEISETGTFMLLAVSAALFVGLGYGIRQQRLSLSLRTAGYVVAGLVIVSVVLVGADALGGGVTYSATFEETVTVESPEEPRGDREFVPVEVTVGTVTATNQFVFTRPLELPTFRGCVAGVDGVPSEVVSLSYEQPSYERSGTISGNTERTFSIRATIPLPADGPDQRTFAIERGSDCEGTRDEPTLIVASGSEISPRR